MKTALDCIPCFFRQTLEAARMVTPRTEEQRQIINEVGKRLEEISLEATPAEAGKLIHKIIRDLSKNQDPYKELKEKYTKLALQFYPELKKQVARAKDPLLMAVKVAIAGNVIDFGVGLEVDVEQELKKSLSQEFAIFDYRDFVNALGATDRVLYLADNAGETVFDRVLIEQLNKQVTYVVKESPIINDATAEDARAAGLEKICDVVSAGCDAPGTILSMCSPDFMKRYQGANFIISKGQGNYEALSEQEKLIFFLLKVKCLVIARHIGANIKDIVLLNNLRREEVKIREHRQDLRVDYRLQTEVRTSDILTPGFTGVVKDLSISGCRLMASQALAPDILVSVNFGPELSLIPARVKWSKKVGEKYEVGLQFINLPSEKRRLLMKKIIDSA